MNEITQVITDQPVVNIAMPQVSNIVTPQEQTEAKTEELSPSNPQNVDKPLEVVVEKTNPRTGENEETMRFSVVSSCSRGTGHVGNRKTNSCIYCGSTPLPSGFPYEDEVKIEEKRKEGRPCEFCQKKEEILQITKLYLDSGYSVEKPKMLFLNELAMKLRIHRDTMYNWIHKKNEDSLEHPEFVDMVKELETLQELRLQQGLMGRYNPTGKIFLLKTKHGYIETEKKVIGGDKDEPLQITIVEEDRKRAQED